MKNEEKIINIEYGINDNNNNFIYTNNNVQPIFKLDFNFDILNEPMPDFTKSKLKGNKFINRKNFAYKRRYTEINPRNDTYHINPTPKIE